jgi:hypothetical protein
MPPEVLAQFDRVRQNCYEVLDRAISCVPIVYRLFHVPELGPWGTEHWYRFTRSKT